MGITLQELKSHLWNCAEILRGSAVDRTDWKAFILPLLFFKRICDVWDEETAEAAALFGDADPVEFPEVHRFQIPEGCHWRDIREAPANIGAALARAMREIERSNPDTLYRVFGASEWGSRELLAGFDCVIANPPFPLKEWGLAVWQADPWGRVQFGLPPRSYGDYAWVQHMVASMAPATGRMAVVLPQGAMFRKGAEGAIRRKLLDRDLVEAVIGLAPNIFYGTGLASAVMLLRRRKPTARQHKVLIADASILMRKGRAQNFLDTEHGAQIVKWVRDFKDVADRAKVVGLDEIKDEDWTLNISRYVLPPVGKDLPPLPEAVAGFKEALTEARAAEDRLRDVLVGGGWVK